MSRKAGRVFWCTVVSESVLIRLRRADGFERERGHVVQCNQSECQYVDANEPPCPLHIGMFAEEIKAIADARSWRDEYENR
jgi:hypothetical protein